MNGQVASLYGLDDDDRRLLYELTTGHSDKRVATRLGSSDRTVRRRLSLIMRGFGVSSRFSLGVLLGQLGLVRMTLPPAAPPEQTPPPARTGVACGCRV